MDSEKPLIEIPATSVKAKMPSARKWQGDLNLNNMGQNGDETHAGTIKVPAALQSTRSLII